MAKQKQKLIVVAHPDDETLFFGGLILADKKCAWTIVCVTDGNADGKKAERYAQFRSAAKKLGVAKVCFFEMPDRYERRLDVVTLTRILGELPPPDEVYTHGPLGEYGHPHHQDVSLAVHRQFRHVPVYSVAHNCLPDKLVRLSPAAFAKKAEILSGPYFSETERFIGFVPATFAEGFARLDLKEVESIHAYLSREIPIAPKNLKKYKWFRRYFSTFRERLKQRPF